MVCALAGHAVDGSRFLLRHEIFRPDRTLSVRVRASSAGAGVELGATGQSRALPVRRSSVSHILPSFSTKSKCTESPSRSSPNVSLFFSFVVSVQ